MSEPTIALPGLSLAELPGMSLLAELESLTDADPRDLGQAQLGVLRRLFESRDEGIGLFLFARTIFGYRDLTINVHLPMCRIMSRWGESVYADGWSTTEVPTEQHIKEHGELTDSYRRLMFTVPRDSYKSSLCTRANTLWQIARDPLHNLTFGIFNEKAENAEAWVFSITQVIERNKLFHLLWPEMLPRGISFIDQEKGITRRRDVKWGAGGILFERDAIGIPELSIEPHGIGGTVVGKHYSHRVLDDIIGQEAAYSAAVMTSAINWIDNARPLEKPAEHGCELVANTPWSYHDCYAHMLSKWPGEYRVYRRHLLENELGEPDIHTGESILPHKFSTAKAKQLLKTDFFVNMCLSPETPILLPDFTEVPICTLKRGQKILGVDFMALNRPNKWGVHHRPVLVETTVDEIVCFEAELLEHTFDDRTIVRCTKEHRWWSGRSPNEREYMYRPLGPGRGKPFTKLIKAFDRVDDVQLSTRQINAAAYLGGIFDGEGCVASFGKGNHRNYYLEIASQSLGKNPMVCTRIDESLKLLGFRYSVNRRGDNEMLSFKLLGGRQERYRFLKLCNPARNSKIKLSLQRLYDKKEINLVSTMSIGTEMVYGITTGTTNYVANLCISSNSQYMCLPLPSKEQAFDPAWIKYGQIIDRGRTPVFSIFHEHYNPNILDLECGDETAPMQVPLNWMSKAILLDPAPSKPTDLKKEPRAGNGICVVGKDPWGRRYLLEARSERETPNRIFEILFELSDKWSTNRIGIEEVNFSAVYAPLFRELGQYKYPDWKPEFFPLTTKGWEKFDRIKKMLITPYENGFWYYNTKGTSKAVKEIIEFGTTGAPVDILDASSYTDQCLQRPETPDETHQKYFRLHSEQQGRGLTGYGAMFEGEGRI